MHGIIQGANTTRVYEHVIVASIQTIAKRGLPPVDLLIIDEAHMVAGSREYLRHKDVRTTMVYLEKNMERITSAQKNIERLGNMAWRESGEHRPANPHHPSVA